MPSSINNRLEAIRRVSSRTPAYSILNIVAIDNIKNRVTGETYGSFEEAVHALEQYTLVDYRRIGSEAFSMGRSTGAGALESELLAINQYLNDPTSQAALRARGLGHLHGQKLDLAYMQFNFGGNAQTLSSLMDPNSPFGKFSGTVAATDEGLMRTSYMLPGAESSLSAIEQSALKSLAGVPTFRPEFVQDIFSSISNAAALPDGSDEKTRALSKISGKLGKLGKRLTRNISPRDVSIDSLELQNILSSMRPSGGGAGELAYTYDHVDLLLRKAAGDTTISSLDDLILASSGGFYKHGVFLPQGDALEQVLSYAGLTHPLKHVDPENFSGQLSEDLQDALIIRDASTDPTMTMHKALKEVVSRRGDSENKLYVGLVDDLADNITPANDGALWLMEGPLQKVVEKRRSQLTALQASLETTGSISQESVKQLQELSGEIEMFEEIIKNHSKSSNSFTAAFGEGSFKAKASVKFIDDIISSIRPGYTYSGSDPRRGATLADVISDFESRLASGPLSADEKNDLKIARRLQEAAQQLEKYFIVSSKEGLKRELGSEAGSFISMNIAKSHADTVYTDPMDLLVNPQAMSPEMQRATQANLDEAAKLTDEFFRTGQVPEEVLSSLEYQGKQLGLIDSRGRKLRTPKVSGTNLSEELLTPAARALQLRNRQQVQQILDLMAQNPDPRSIPQLVDMVRDHYAKTAFRTKDGIINTAIPFATRKDIRTYESEGKIIPGVFEDGTDIRKVRLKDGRVVDIPLVQASYDGDGMMVSGVNASIYKGQLSGFDLDDTAIGNLQTYTDEKGRTRIMQKITRDPKGLQEEFFVSPTIRHAESLQAIVGTGQSRVSRAVLAGISSPTIGDSLRQRMIAERNSGRNHSFYISRHENNACPWRWHILI
jgi:hypothetical protein